MVAPSLVQDPAGALLATVVAEVREGMVKTARAQTPTGHTFQILATTPTSASSTPEAGAVTRGDTHGPAPPRHPMQKPLLRMFCLPYAAGVSANVFARYGDGSVVWRA